jgi:hypothetical protein
MKTTTVIINVSLTSLSFICIAVGQTVPTPAASIAPSTATASGPAAQVPATNAMDNFRRNQERMQRMNAMQKSRGAQLDAAKKAATAAKQKSQAVGASAETTNPTTTTSEPAPKSLAETTKAATQASGSPTASATAAAVSPKN